MKSFRFFIQVGASPSVTLRFSCFAERADLRQAFTPQALRYRRRLWYGVLALLTFLFGTWLLAETRLGHMLGLWGASLLGGSWLLAMVLLLWRLRLVCPGCGKGLVPARGPYCPCCGSEEFERGRHRKERRLGGTPYCPHCGVDLDEGAGDDPRAYRIHGCTHCGAFLDNAGV